MKKRRIVLASVLKPVDETRMFEKLGATLADSGDFDVFIIGTAVNPEIVYTSTQFLGFSPFSRLSVKRLLAPWKVFQKLIHIKPEVVIITTHELLYIALVYRAVFKTQVIYDIQENYFRNILHTHAFPMVLRNFVAFWVRLKEKFTAPFVDWFLLAEKGYEKEFSFYKPRFTIVENKFKKPDQFKRQPAPNKINLLFTGTLAESTGIFDAIELAKRLHHLEPVITLTIIGYCAQASTREKLRLAISKYEYVTLVGGDQPVPHTKIMTAISQAHFGIVCYPSSPHTENSIPTKLYEYLGCELPVLLQNHRPWIELTLPYPAAISVDFVNVDAAEILQKMKETTFFIQKPTHVYWDDEASKLLEVVQNLRTGL